MSLPYYFNGGLDIIAQGQKQKVNFYQTDDEESFKKNLKTQPEDWHYRTKEITYDLNTYGFRTDEFNEIDWKNSIVIFGCSIVFGVGVAEDETISSALSKLTGRKVINMGIPGASNELIFNTSLMVRKKYGEPYGVVFLWSAPDRTTYYTESAVEHMGSWTTNIKKRKIDKILNNLYENLNYDDTHNIIRNRYIFESARQVWSNLKYFFEGTFFGYMAYSCDLTFYFSYDQTARDLSHPGKDEFLSVANRVYDKFRVKLI